MRRRRAVTYALLERLGPWRWRASVGSWEEHGITQRAAVRRLQRRYELYYHYR